MRRANEGQDRGEGQRQVAALGLAALIERMIRDVERVLASEPEDEYLRRIRG